MTRQCLGCGAVLQYIDSEGIGYIEKTHYGKNQICMRCFRIKNYHDYKMITKDQFEYQNMLAEIGKTNDLVVLVLDVLHLPMDLSDVEGLFSNPLLIVLTKRDLLPKSIKDETLLQYLTNYKIKPVDQLVISSFKNYQFDELMDKIKTHQTSPQVYVVGYTNAGKSSMINQMIKHYSSYQHQLITSFLPSTTLNLLEIQLQDSLTIIDTPGFLDAGNIVQYASVDELKKIMPKKTIRPITYQIKVPQTIIIDEFIELFCADLNNITLYLSNTLVIDRKFNHQPFKHLYKTEITIGKNQDLVISGLGFIRFQKKTTIQIASKYDINIDTRKALIGKDV